MRLEKAFGDELRKIREKIGLLQQSAGVMIQ
jgi:hypothetical protein